MLLPILRQIEQKALVERSARGFRRAARLQNGLCAVYLYAPRDRAADFLNLFALTIAS